MELRRYWQVVKDRGWIVLGVTAIALVAAVLSVVALPPPLPSYQATIQLSVKPGRFPEESYQRYGEYYLFLASEYLNDDVINIVKSPGFQETLGARYSARPEGPPSGSIRGEKAHRVVTFTVSSDHGSDALDLARGIEELLSRPAAGEPNYLERLSYQEPIVTVIDEPRLIVQPGVRRGALDVAVRALLGLLVGLGLAFLFHYLDDTVRDRAELEQTTGLPVIGEIPRQGRERARRKRAA